MPRSRPLRILIDGMNLALEQGTGVATYSRNLSVCVKMLGHHLVALYGKQAPERGDAVLREAMFADAPPAKFDIVRETRALARVVRTARPALVPDTGLVIRDSHQQRPDCDAVLNWRDLFRTAQHRFSLTGGFLEVVSPEPVDIAHWTYPIPIRLRGARNIYTFHDLVPLKLPYATLDRKERYYRLLRKIVRDADHVVTVSECSRDDILSMLPAAPEKVTNTYQSVTIPGKLLSKSREDVDIELAHAFHAPLGEAANKAPGNVDTLTREGFYLYVGAIEPKKNLRRVIEAYLASGVPEPLVVVGRQAWQFKDVVNMMARSPRIIYLDYLPFSQMITLMRSARALVFASLYEGFGLPVLEAFLCGTPVVTASISSTAEIAGDAALLVDPTDTAAIRDAFRRLSAPDSEPLRRALAAKGLARAEAFSEARVADAIDACYARVMAS
ncbi:glycosyltransferase family 4 protein [Rubrimonas cliftonensis]|uniref:Glycosyltransferase involved in cell wall bisynthesis n=1 Tax=Rubrimonas cliftonensis TaxID=89524 RepID=A0A1H4CX40_9RHOB|nr:glycosyltransferase family 1 protein [Rubrimonas cliftonensis]SEA64971.1 Glycosyltransferase involved in cell wall bisynthesis [Rubrimonas cliftonensis]